MPVQLDTLFSYQDPRAFAAAPVQDAASREFAGTPYAADFQALPREVHIAGALPRPRWEP